MNLLQIKRLHNKDAIPSMEAYVEAYLNEKITHNGLTETSYMVTMDDERIPLKMQFPQSVRLNVGETYQLKSKPTTIGLSGLSLFVYGQYRSVICTTNATWQTLKQLGKMEEPNEIATPVSMEATQNYILRMYFQTRKKTRKQEYMYNYSQVNLSYQPQVVQLQSPSPTLI